METHYGRVIRAQSLEKRKNEPRLVNRRYDLELSARSKVQPTISVYTTEGLLTLDVVTQDTPWCEVHKWYDHPSVKGRCLADVPPEEWPSIVQKGNETVQEDTRSAVEDIEMRAAREVKKRQEKRSKSHMDDVRMIRGETTSPYRRGGDKGGGIGGGRGGGRGVGGEEGDGGVRVGGEGGGGRGREERSGGVNSSGVGAGGQGGQGDGPGITADGTTSAAGGERLTQQQQIEGHALGMQVGTRLDEHGDQTIPPFLVIPLILVWSEELRLLTAMKEDNVLYIPHIPGNVDPDIAEIISEIQKWLGHGYRLRKWPEVQWIKVPKKHLSGEETSLIFLFLDARQTEAVYEVANMPRARWIPWRLFADPHGAMTTTTQIGGRWTAELLHEANSCMPPQYKLFEPGFAGLMMQKWVE
ncbi:hypothetical protein CBR_g19170 [Chara braunii]|uniref:Uncharacterized protein n=1 Tax=Chara braunii TaxID=69332 RepID=A0A388JTF2_CHABU|nr:hypothetical protein CBR_g19170 [Chara braunii]|eukprot:GBG61094.1 hypothetical protein CBR_g19170 [Chara braunii]